MRALIWWGESDVRLTEVDEPKPQQGDVLVKVLAAGICGSDVGRYAGRGSGQPPPIILGHEFVGEIVAGSTEGDLKIGDRVAVHPLLTDGTCAPCKRGFENLCRSRSLIGAHRAGAFAEFVAVPAASCYRIPSDRPVEVGALVEPLACALRAAERSEISSGDSLFVIGAGALGLLFVQAAKWAGVREIIVSDVSASRREVALRLGADRVVDPGTVDQGEQAASLGRGVGADVVVDAVGSASTRRQALDLVSPGGRVVLVGLHDKVLDASAAGIVLNEISLIGSFAYTRRSFAESVDRVAHGLLDGFARECQARPLTDGPVAFAELARGSVAAPRILLTLDPAVTPPPPLRA